MTVPHSFSWRRAKSVLCTMCPPLSQKNFLRQYCTDRTLTAGSDRHRKYKAGSEGSTMHCMDSSRMACIRKGSGYEGGGDVVVPAGRHSEC